MDSAAFTALLTRMTQAAIRGDGTAVMHCFTPHGVYDDVFYGRFEGEAIVDLIERYFHRDAERFIWDLHDPVCSGNVGYARYVFSYDSKLAATVGTRAIFEGVSICELEGGRISRYREVANAAVGLSCLGFAPERLARIVARAADELKQRTEVARHFQR